MKIESDPEDKRRETRKQENKERNTTVKQTGTHRAVDLRGACHEDEDRAVGARGLLRRRPVARRQQRARALARLRLHNVADEALHQFVVERLLVDVLRQKDWKKVIF